MPYITIQISERDLRDALQHIACRAAGKRLVAVEAIVDLDPSPSDYRPISPELASETLDEF